MRARLRRAARRMARGAVGRPDDATRLTHAQRDWLLEDVREDLEAMIDDAENRGVSGRTAREMIAARALVGWLEGGDPPDAEAIGYLERGIRAIPRNPGKKERFFRTTYLAAIGALSGDEEAAAQIWKEPSDDPEETRRLFDLQGRRIRELMDQRGLTVGGLARRSGIETVTLVSILFGLEEMKVVEMIRLSGALDVTPDDLIPDRRSIDDERGGVR